MKHAVQAVLGFPRYQSVPTAFPGKTILLEQCIDGEARVVDTGHAERFVHRTKFGLVTGMREMHIHDDRQDARYDYPARPDRFVAPADLLGLRLPDILGDRAPVMRSEGADRKLAVSGCRPVYLRKKIPEPEGQVLVDQRFGNAFEKRLPACNEKRRMPRHNGTFDAQCAREGGNAGHAGETTGVPVAGSNIDNGGKSAGVPGRETARIKIDPVQYVGRESGIEPEHMERLVHKHPVEMHEVLGGFAAAHVILAAAIARRDDAGKHRKVIRQIGGNVGGRHELDFFGQNALAPRGDAGHPVLALGLHKHFVEFRLRRNEGGMPAGGVSRGKRESIPERFVAYERDGQFVRPRLNTRNDIDAVRIGGDAVRRNVPGGVRKVPQHSGGSGQRLPVRGVRNETAQGGAPGLNLSLRLDRAVPRRKRRQGDDGEHYPNNPVP